MASFDKNYLRLYLVLESSMLKIPLGDFIRQVTEGGVTAIQLRDKFSSPKEKYEKGKEIQTYFGAEKPFFIVNDSIELALALNADGVHLGIDDIPISEARLLASDLVIGYSCNTFEDCEKASLYSHYAGVGPVYSTLTKKNLRPVLGLEGLGKNIDKLTVPCVAIGGINKENCNEVLGSKVNGIAVSSSVCASDDPYGTVCALLQKINERI